MVHGMAALLAGLLVLATVLVVAIDFVRTKIRRAREATVRSQIAAACEKDDGTRHLEAKVNEKMEEIETLKGLSGIQSDIGYKVRAALAAGTVSRRLSDSQIARDFQANAEEVMRLAKKKRAVNG